MAKIKAIITAKDVNASSTFKSFGATVIALNQGLELTKKVMRGLSAPFGAIISEGKAFGAQMSAVAAISKTTAADFKTLSDEAKRIGATTAFTAIEAGKAMEELRRAGMGVSAIMKTTSQAMDLAAATGADLATAASTVAVQLNLFKESGLKAKDAVDLIVQTVGASPQSFEDLNQAITESGGTASAFGKDFNELTSILGAMAEAGVKGGKAGTALNAVFARLAKPTGEAAAVFNAVWNSIGGCQSRIEQLRRYFGQAEQVRDEAEGHHNAFGAGSGTEVLQSDRCRWGCRPGFRGKTGKGKYSRRSCRNTVGQSRRGYNFVRVGVVGVEDNHIRNYGHGY